MPKIVDIFGRAVHRTRGTTGRHSLFLVLLLGCKVINTGGKTDWISLHHTLEFLLDVVTELFKPLGKDEIVTRCTVQFSSPGFHD